MVVGAFGFGVSGLGLVGRGLCWRVWGRWVGVGQRWFVRVKFVGPKQASKKAKGTDEERRR